MNERDDRQLTDEQRIDWLRLFRTENVGPRTFRALLNQFGGAGRALARLPELARRGGRVVSIPPRNEAEDEIAASAAIGVRFVAIGEPDYPPHLRRSEDSPPLLAVRGNAKVLLEPAVAVVGARNASAAGLRLASVLARDLGAAVSPSFPASPAASIPPDTAVRSRPALSPYSPAVTTSRTRLSTWTCSQRSSSAGPPLARCRSVTNRGHATFPAAIGLSPALPLGSWW